MAERNTKEYRGPEVVVGFDASRCIHASRCVRELPEVFDVERRPWIQPEAASAESVITQVGRCPTGALTAHRPDGRPIETTPAAVEIDAIPDGPLYVRGAVRVTDADGGVFAEQRRVALCRCGASANKPFCDGSHTESGFTA
jgi:uncharacterized Fe-S cluster protein YjdI